MKDLELAPCQLPTARLSCYGCCGRGFDSGTKIREDIKDNTKDFKKIKIPSTLRLLIFRDRFSKNPDDLKDSGICSNLVDFGDNIYACPLHKNIQGLIPKERQLFIHKKDLRINHCDVNCECETLIYYNLFSKEQKEEFVRWVREQSYDNDKYSKENIKGELIIKFMNAKNYKID